MKVIGVKNLAFVKPNKVEYEILKDKLFFVVNEEGFGFKKNLEIKLYEERDGGVYIPRAINRLFERVEDAGWERVNIPFYGRLRDYQKDLVNRFIEEGGNGIIKLDTGLGKTVLALYLAHFFKLKTLVIVPTSTLLKQWVNRVKEFCGFYPTTISGAYCDVSTPIVIGMLKTLAIGKRIDREKLRNLFGFTIYDEVHRVPTDRFNVVAGFFWDKYRLGLSATPYRKDGSHRIVMYHIGSIIKADYRTKLLPTVQTVFYSTNTISLSKCYIREELILPKFLNKISSAENRNLLIALYVYYGYIKNRNILVLSDRIEILKIVKRLLIRLGVPNSEIGLCFSDKKQLNRKIILSTYGSGGEGLDIPCLDYIVLATPRANIKQALGRVLRPKDKNPIIIDIVDYWNDVMIKFYKKRKKEYMNITNNIKEVIVGDSDIHRLYEKIKK